ncbi:MULTISPECIES: 4'-phosphopantetheinyl transferase superfamily protein [unclassified Streptomyces]|uniref:4'-phosphopantetheinyl transferase family protein n=2 Tax=Streptomyces TaxID=1883 RepID=UPI0013E8CE1E|nr:MULTISPECIES: 4'-phosphopantetheinyl transferase superfamily protein [unclassified Streptomyces]MBY8341418.1 4'-phosphopantetheinyl transferase superfamily protein [Streptomyces plumbidurans]
MHSSGTVLTLPRALCRSGPRIPGVGFATASVHEGPPVAVEEAERRLSLTMPPRRRADFLTGRSALHRALRVAGLAAGAVLCDGPRPLLPEGISASISHSGGVAVAVAGPSEQFRTLGVDLELGGLPQEAAHLVLRGPETRLLRGAPDAAAQRLLTLYSAKEAAFKALSPVIGPELLGLRDIRLEASADGYLAQATRRPGPLLHVSTRQLPQGVLCWAVPQG